MCKQYSHVYKKENILYRQVEFNLVAHTLKSFSFHITIAKIVYLGIYVLTESCTLGKKKKFESSYLNVDFF